VPVSCSFPSRLKLISTWGVPDVSMLVICMPYPSPTYQVSPSLRLLSVAIVTIDAEVRDMNNEIVISKLKVNTLFFMV